MNRELNSANLHLRSDTVKKDYSTILISVFNYIIPLWKIPLDSSSRTAFCYLRALHPSYGIYINHRYSRYYNKRIVQNFIR